MLLAETLAERDLDLAERSFEVPDFRPAAHPTADHANLTHLQVKQAADAGIKLMERLEDAGRHVVHELERFLNTLGTVAAVAPLLGLLGTVTGIMSAFSAINEGAIGDPKMLSGGISEALITTAAGLLVAIPALVAYRYLRGRVDGLVVEMEKQAIALADAVETAGPRPPVRGRGKSAA